MGIDLQPNSTVTSHCCFNSIFQNEPSVPSFHCHTRYITITLIDAFLFQSALYIIVVSNILDYYYKCYHPATSPAAVTAFVV